MPWVDLVDETFVVAAPDRVAALLREPATWRAWWPDLTLTVFEDRGASGIRWSCTGALVGSCEVWLEPWCDGVLVHYYLRADPTRPGSATEPWEGADLARRSVAVRERWARHTKTRLFALKDRLEAGREVGSGVVGAPVPSGERSATMPEAPAPAPTAAPAVSP